MRRSLFALPAMTLCFAQASSALAATQTVTTEIPRIGNISAATGDAGELAKQSAGPKRFEINVSSWAPSDLKAASYSSSVQTFRDKSFAQLGVAYIPGPWWTGSALSFSPKLDARYLGMSRSADIKLISTEKSTQHAHLLMVGFGGQIAFSKLRSRTLEPYLGAMILPTVLGTEQSMLGPSDSSFGAIAEGSVGAATRLWGGSALVPQLELNLEAARTFGHIGQADLGGSAFRVGLRFLL